MVFFSIGRLRQTLRSNSITSTHRVTRLLNCYYEFRWLNSIPYSFFFVSSKSRILPSYSFSVIFLPLLSGDVELNPGHISNKFVVCTFNIRSIWSTNLLLFMTVYVLADSYHINLFCLFETWLTDLTSFANFFTARLLVSHSSTLIDLTYLKPLFLLMAVHQYDLLYVCLSQTSRILSTVYFLHRCQLR